MGKLVRDKIPEIIGKGCKYRILDEEEYEVELFKKLQEEVNELLEDHDSIEEIIDVLTVLSTIAHFKGISDSELSKAMITKYLEKGLFDERYYLEDET